MSDPELFDVIELLTDVPEQNLRAGTQGTIVHQYSDEIFEIEFTNTEGETLALCALPFRQFIVVWQSEYQRWVPVVEQLVQIVARLPEKAGTEVLDFARFISVRTEHRHPTRVERVAA
ncbi:MAG: DUF4926 domain-containing protein [Chloroflexi bacterium]|nr:DUF4926 domain-containing protein [Chloroflexota bacterium]MBU1662885.1 DUF4926 domain-containing protein [Chloroflexota bacterium]